MNGIDSFKGIKLRTTESQAEMATVEALGASAMPLAWADTITAIEQNTVNGWATTDSYAKNCGAYEIIQNAIDTEHNLTLHLVVMNKAYYDSLPADIQEIIMRAGKEAMENEVSNGENDRIEKQNILGHLMSPGQSSGKGIPGGRAVCFLHSSHDTGSIPVCGNQAGCVRLHIMGGGVGKISVHLD